jgi:hypothetical protein
MSETLSANHIRRLILKAKLPGGALQDMARTIASMAKEENLISSVPDFAYSTQVTDGIAQAILAVVWEMIIEGLYAPSSSIQHPNPSAVRVTDYGRRCLEAGELTAYDPDQYLQRLKGTCPNIDDVTLLYVGEALNTFRMRRFLPAVVMVGVAAESMLLRLVSSVGAALDSPQKQQKFDQETKGKFAKTLHDQVMKRLKSPSNPLPPDLDSILSRHVDGIYDFIRTTRNDAGHPTGRQMEANEAHALLLLFPTYCETVERLIDWLKTNKI